MKNLLNLILLLFPCFLIGQESDLKLWYQQPAVKWTEALPLGNGRLGAMVHGRYDHELFQMNEESLWAGGPINNNNPESASNLKEIQDAIFRNQFDLAKELATKYMVGTPARIRSYQPLGNVSVNYNWGSNQVEDYSRVLNLNEGVHQTLFTVNSNKIIQTSYIPSVGDALFLKWESRAAISFTVKLDRSRDVNEYGTWKNGAYYTGQIQDSVKKDAGPAGSHMQFAAGLMVKSIEGEYEVFSDDKGSGIRFKDVKKLELVYTGITDYELEELSFTGEKNLKSKIQSKLNHIQADQTQDYYRSHVHEHRSMFERVKVAINSSGESNFPTDQRLKAFSEGKEDFGLPVLFYQYGRYLLMSSSRSPGRLPANLQGIWNQEYEAPWNSDFHTNINLQMNYWPAESGDLGESSVILANFMKELMKPGERTAKEMYAARGWTIHHLTDPFGRTGVADGVWGVSPMAGPWMTFPVYRHFAFSQDRTYLKNVAYPILKGSLLWVLDFLIKSPEGYLVTNPSHSPENEFKTMVDGKEVRSQLSYMSTIDIEIILELFDNFEEAATLLKEDKELLARIKEVRKQLPPIRVGKNGGIQEWIHDYDEVEPGHRHMSHLLGLYPGNSINPNDPKLFEAAKKTIENRLASGGGHTGWSKAWIVNFYARLYDGEQANKHLKELIGKTCLPNLFSTHPPFQIDGNFGGAAGFAEMLVQSQNGEIHLLPAVPVSWKSGSVDGIKTRGDKKVSFKWENNRIVSLTVQAKAAEKIKVRFGKVVKEFKVKEGLNTLTLN
ncbi:glycosyl hydrolase family 95 catalytic domain-containing protein [Sphingobacterium mizutaii]|uniref:glycoside hydrolase family 95 protein n=1 Tax=Sphingobacterium mizutaii TaxID=1010 RepID=UPI0016261573|nr:glycoside hydrolase family 95 protein [Sphingobacterium mizutaii]